MMVGDDSMMPSSGEILASQEVRREAALSIGATEDDQMSGAVSADELAAALAQSQPQLGPPTSSGNASAHTCWLAPRFAPSPAALPEGLPPDLATMGSPCHPVAFLRAGPWSNGNTTATST